MKIALLHYSAPPVIGGVESVLAQHARLFSAGGHNVRVIAGSGQAWMPAVEFIPVPLAGSRHPEILTAKSELDQGRIPAQFESLVAQLTHQLSQALRGVDVLIAHNVCSLNKNLALTAALQRLNTSPGFPRLILWHHDLAWSVSRYRGELYPGYPWDLLRMDWPSATQVVVSSLRQAELVALTGLPPERVQVVPNGIDIAVFLKLEPETITWYEQLRLREAAPLLLLPVRITPRKNLEMALRILADLRVDFPQAAMLVTGPLGAHNPANQDYFAGLLALRARLRLEKCAHFLAESCVDTIPDVVIADFYRLADALLLPSLEEGFGIPLIEAALGQRPVFCTDLNPLRALAGEDARYFNPQDDPRQVAEMIAATLKASPVFRFAVRTRQRYTWEGIYTEKIAPLLGGGAGGI
jgi:glycosyltransferase involved in cell wall biosynthesis